MPDSNPMFGKPSGDTPDFLKSFFREKSTQDEKVRFIKWNEL